MGELRPKFADKEEFLNGKDICVRTYTEIKGKYGDEAILTYEDENGEDQVISLWFSAMSKYCKNVLCRRNFDRKDFENKIFRVQSKVLSTDAQGNKKIAWLPIDYLRDFTPVENVV